MNILLLLCFRRAHKAEVMRLTQELRAASTGAKGGSAAAERLKKELEKTRFAPQHAAAAPDSTCERQLLPRQMPVPWVQGMLMQWCKHTERGLSHDIGHAPALVESLRSGTHGAVTRAWHAGLPPMVASAQHPFSSSLETYVMSGGNAGKR